MDWKTIIAGVIGGVLTAAILYFAAVIGKIPTLLVPSGTVIAYDGTGCPSGYEPYDAGENRFIIGAGDNARGTTGGDEKILLTEDHLPIHAHRQSLSGGRGLQPGFKHTDAIDQAWNFTAHGDNNTHLTDTAGMGQPVSNIPPFVALQFCRRK